MGRLRVAACQINTVVGDLWGNAGRVRSALAEAEAAGADLAVFPELTVTGYPPEDLLGRPAFIADNQAVLEDIAATTGPCASVVGFVDTDARGRLVNAAAVCAGGRVVGRYHKRLLPNYGVFDEQRWFVPGEGPPDRYLVAGVPIGVTICEDMWSAGGPMVAQAAAGAGVLVNLNASPYSRGRRDERLAVLSERVSETACPIVYVNQVGGQDELVFDGASLVMDARGHIVASAPQFSEAVLVADVTTDSAAPSRSGLSRSGRAAAPVTVSRAPGARSIPESDPAAGPLAPVLGPEAEVYQALVLGTRDYVTKNGFPGALIGLSGGIDSSLVAAVAVDALGPERVHGVTMPSRYSSQGSVGDAATLSANLGIQLATAAIEEAHRALSATLSPLLGGDPTGLTDENLQSRIRGVLLMAVSNATGWIVLTTGNKSEMATGYSTLYGDSAGGFAVIKDVPKTLVYELCTYRNRVAGFDLIPDPVLTKAPSAELRPDQRDDESLPPYAVLDPVVDGYVVGDRSAEELVASGLDPDAVSRVVALVDRAEYKRRQMPPGVRISGKAFGKDRRMPITNHYRPGAHPGARPEQTNAEPPNAEQPNGEQPNAEQPNEEQPTGDRPSGEAAVV
jgi:NAD+ synthase (glutamine-hydrolysing)